MDKKFIWLVGGGLALIIILVVVLVIVNYSGKRNAPTTGSKTLTVWDYNNEKTAYDPFIVQFQRDHNIKVQYVAKNAASYLADTVSAIAAGTGPDVWIVPADILPQYRDKLVAMPKGSLALPKEKKNDLEVLADLYPAVVVTDNVFESQVFGLPVAMDTLKLYMNTELMQTALQEYRRAHPDEDLTIIQSTINKGPKNWDEFNQLVRWYTQKAGAKITRSAVALGTPNNVSRATDILTLMMLQDGAKMTSDDLSTAQFHTAQNRFGGPAYPGAQALEYFAGFANTQNKNYTWNGDQGDSIRAFAEGKVAMMFDYNTAASAIKIITANLNYQTFDVPQARETANPVNLARYDTLVVTKASQNSALAWQFVLEASNPGNNSSYFSVTKKDRARLNSATDAAKTAQSWYNPDTTKVMDIFKNMITQANEGKSIQTAVEGAASQVTTLLQKLKGQ